MAPCRVYLTMCEFPNYLPNIVFHKFSFAVNFNIYSPSYNQTRDDDKVFY